MTQLHYPEGKCPPNLKPVFRRLLNVYSREIATVVIPKFLCVAVKNTGIFTEQEIADVRAFIGESLGDSFSLGTWLASEELYPETCANYTMRSRYSNRCREAWLKYLTT